MTASPSSQRLLSLRPESEAAFATSPGEACKVARPAAETGPLPNLSFRPPKRLDITRKGAAAEDLESAGGEESRAKPESIPDFDLEDGEGFSEAGLLPDSSATSGRC